MRFAYADPPYLGLAVQFYGEQAAEYDTIEGHAALIDRLCSLYDGWALSLHEPSLRTILPLCPADARLGVWVKPFASFKLNVRFAHCWEPVVFYGWRPRKQTTVRDYVSTPIVLRAGFQGAKPEPFTRWVLDVLNVQPDDDFDDLFPGSGAVSRAYERWLRERPLWDEEAVDPWRRNAGQEPLPIESDG